MASVTGYHGCKRTFAEGVRSGRIPLDEWKASENEYDWLGKGIYFWEASKTRAIKWATDQFGAEDAALVEVDIDLGRCLDLLESTYHDAIRRTYEDLATVYRAKEWPLPTNERKRHKLDSLVINQFITIAEGLPEGIRFQTVRGVFEEGLPLFPGSAIRSESHIQIAVRDVQCIRLRA